MFCTLFRNREERENPGGFLTADAAATSGASTTSSRSTHGLHMRHGTEPEMMWLKKDENGKPNGGYSNPYCYHIDQFESLRPVYMRVIEYGRKMGLDMIQGDHEDAPGQLELNFNYDDALRTADRLTTYRQICAQVAREFNLIACFMSKPFMGVSANGCHHNLSLWSGGEDEFKALGNDAKTCRAWRATTCIAAAATTCSCPTAGRADARPDRPLLDRRRRQAPRGPDRDRLLDGQLLPAAVGHRVLGAGLRRLGFPEPHVGPAPLGARPVRVPRGRLHGEPVSDGGGASSRRSTTASTTSSIPGKPEERNIYAAMEAGKQVKKLPMTLGDALEALKKDEVIKSALPGEMYRLYDEYKRDEWERFLHTSTEWDIKMYMDCLP